MTFRVTEKMIVKLAKEALPSLPDGLRWKINHNTTYGGYRFEIIDENYNIYETLNEWRMTARETYHFLTNLRRVRYLIEDRIPYLQSLKSS